MGLSLTDADDEELTPIARTVALIVATILIYCGYMMFTSNVLAAADLLY